MFDKCAQRLTRALPRSLLSLKVREEVLRGGRVGETGQSPGPYLSTVARGFSGAEGGRDSGHRTRLIVPCQVLVNENPSVGVSSVPSGRNIGE